MSPTFKDLYDFVLDNKTDKAFVGCSDDRITNMLYEHLYNNTLYYHTNSTNRIEGMAIFELHKEHKLIFVLEIIAMSLSMVKEFARKSTIDYPGYRLEAMRHSKHKIFTSKFYNKLTI